MSFERTTHNAVGIFGRLSQKLENNFRSLQANLYTLSKDSEAYGIFPHLTLVVSRDVQTDKLEVYKDLLRQLKAYLPFVLEVEDVLIIDDQNVAFAFDIRQTKIIRHQAKLLLADQVIATSYFTVLRNVPQDVRGEAIAALSAVSSLTFTDFTLCIDRVDDNHIICSASEL